MALDPSIPLGIRPMQVQPYDPSEGMVKALTLKNLMQQNQAGEMDARLKQQSYDDEMNLREVFKSSDGTPESIRKGLQRSGMYKQLNEFEKNQAELGQKQTAQKKDLAAISKDKLDMDLKKLEIINNVGMGPFQQYKAAIARGVSPETAKQAIQPSWQVAVSQLRNTGIFDEQFLASVPEQFDPDAVETQLAQTKEYFKMVDNELKRRGQDITVRGQDLSQQTAIRGQDLSRSTAIRGQDVSAATAKRGQDITRQGQVETNARGLAANEIARTKAGNEKITDTQRANSGYAARMEAADGTFGKTKSQKPGLIEMAAGTMPFIGNEVSANVARSLDGDRQQSLQSQEDWVRAKLRKESGAVIAAEEMDREIRTYFPQIGDGEKVIKQKALARKQALQGMKTSAGAAHTEVLKAPQENAFDALPDAKLHPGKIITNTQTGEKSKSVNGQWVAL
jgi:hypothetical protein